MTCDDEGDRFERGVKERICVKHEQSSLKRGAAVLLIQSLQFHTNSHSNLCNYEQVQDYRLTLITKM